jgi:hypothetical protein
MNAPYKGKGPISAKYACGGPEITTRSRFLKTPNVFTTDIEPAERSDYKKKGKGGELAKTEGDNKSQKAIKPRT